MQIRNAYAACLAACCTLTTVGCAQPGFWPKFGAQPILGSPAASQQTPQGARNTAAGKNAPKTSLWGKSQSSSQKQPASNPQDEAARISAARLREQQGHADIAERTYRDILNQNPNCGAAWHRLGVILAGDGHFDESEQCFTHAMSLLPPTAESLNDRGYLLYLQDRHAEAEEFLRQAIAMDRDYAPAHNNLGLVLGAQGKFPEALASFKKCGSDAQAHANLAYIYSQLGELDHSEAHYNHALSLDKSLKIAARALIQVHEKRKQLAMKAPPTSLAENSGTAPVGKPKAVEEAPAFEGDDLISVAERPLPTKASAAQAPQITIADRPEASSRQVATKPKLKTILDGEIPVEPRMAAIPVDSVPNNAAMAKSEVSRRPASWAAANADIVSPPAPSKTMPRETIPSQVAPVSFEPSDEETGNEASEQALPPIVNSAQYQAPSGINRGANVAPKPAPAAAWSAAPYANPRQPNAGRPAPVTANHRYESLFPAP